MGLEMVRVGSKQKNIYVELNEVGITRISARPYKIESDPNGIICIKYKNFLLHHMVSINFMTLRIFVGCRCTIKWSIIEWFLCGIL